MDRASKFILSFSFYPYQKPGTKYPKYSYPELHRIKKEKNKMMYNISLSMRGEHMKNVIDPFISLSYWPSAGGFGSNTNILETNIINPSVVLSVLIYFGKGVCASCIFE